MAQEVIAMMIMIVRILFIVVGYIVVFPLYVYAQDMSSELAIGRSLLTDNKCNGSCHQNIVRGDDPLKIYTRSIRKVNSSDELKRQVDLCVSFLNAPIFPEDVALIVKALDHDAYHFD
jgi:hypothetical protein